MPVYDHLNEANRIAALINAEGLALESAAILNALKAFSGTEIIMRLRAVVAPLLLNEKISDTTKKRLKVFHTKLDDALKA